MKNGAPINVNAASAAELDAIPALAGHGFEIVRYREERGGFSDLRQLDEVPGLTGKADGATASLTVGIADPGGECKDRRLFNKR